MSDVLDYELDKTDEQPPPADSGGRRPRAAWIVAAIVLVALAAAGYWRWSRPATPPAETGPVTAYRAAPEPARPAGPAINLPPLDQSDAMVRQLIAALSSHPRIAAWLATPNLIRTMAVVVENIDSGLSPSRHLRVLRPTPLFRVEGGSRPTLDAASYARFDGIADAAASIDVAGAAALYAGLRPRLEEAYRELGRQGSFDAALERAIVTLLQVPVVEAPIPLTLGQGARYEYADERLQALTPPQQQLLRMGPRNVRIIQEKLAAFRGAALQ